MLSVSRFTLNTHDEQAQLSFSVKQGDTARRIIATLTENGEMFYLSDDCYAVFAANKSDGTKFNDSCVIQDGRIIYDLDPQLTLAVGRADCDITVYSSGGAVISTARFTMTVFESIFAGASDDMVSEDTFHVLNNLIGDANDTINDMEDLNDAVTAAETEREEAEVAREAAEESRADAEDLRVSNEAARVSAESGRVTAESEREEAEDERIAAEAARDAAETARAKAETARETSEAARGKAEAAREEAEAARKEAEEERVDVNNGIVAKASAAASTAAAAAQTASTAAETAATAADAATAAASSASGDAEDAEDAATAAESWTQGGTGTRTGEDTNNAKYWSEQAQAIAGGDYAPRIHTHEVDDITDFPETMPPSAHTHSADDINAGTLSADRLPTVPISKGGTGATSAAQARMNLGAAAASHTHTVGNITDFPATMPPSSHTHNASDINAGTLDTARLPVVPVAKGGTGAATVEEALINLGLTVTTDEINSLDGVNSNVQEQIDDVLRAIGTTSGTAEQFTLNKSGFLLEDGVAVRFRLHIDSGAAPTLNVNGTGAKRIVTMDGEDLPAGIKAGTWLTAVYSSTLGFFVLQGSVNSKTNQSRYGNGIGQISVYESILVPIDTNYDRSTWI